MSTYRLCIFVTVLLVLVIILADLGHAQVDIFQYAQKRPQNTVTKYCGIKLSNALHMVCNGMYNQMFKKSGQGECVTSQKPTQKSPTGSWSLRTKWFAFISELESRDYGYVAQLSPERANAMLSRFAGRFRRESRGVYDECCVKACTTDELRSYCQEQ
ncbi:LIRP-like isoform X1 [Prorops nasuta]|uniref:LIRP-like isoform X1 n=1 Tax=Prorops nasuta TaxID=863751 RepID=UPI0034CE6FBA